MSARKALFILTSINLLNYIDRWLLAAVMPAMKEDLGLSHTVQGIAMSAFMLGYFFTSPIFGYLADRYKRLHIISIGTAVWSGATTLVGFAKSGVQVVLSRMIVGVGEAATVSTSQGLISDYYEPEKRNTVVAIFTAAVPVGAALGFILGGVIAKSFGWRSAFWLAGIPGLLLAFMIYFLKEPKRGQYDIGGYQPSTTFWGDIKSLLKNKPYMLSVLGYAAWTFAVGGLASWIPQYLVSVRGVELHHADTVFGAITVVTGVFGSLFGGWLATRRLKVSKRGDLKAMYWLAYLSIPIGIGCFFVDSIYGFYALISLVEFILFATQPTINVVIMEVVSPAIRSQAIAFSVFMIHLLGDLISPTMVGVAADHSSLSSAVLILPLALIPCAWLYQRAYVTLVGHNIAKP